MLKIAKVWEWMKLTPFLLEIQRVLRFQGFSSFYIKIRFPVELTESKWDLRFLRKNEYPLQENENIAFHYHFISKILECWKHCYFQWKWSGIPSISTLFAHFSILRPFPHF